MSGVGQFFRNIGGPGIKGLLNPSAPDTPLPAIPTPPPAPTNATGTQAAIQAAEMQRRKAMLAPDRRSTLLTGPGGLAAPPVTDRKTLLGL